MFMSGCVFAGFNASNPPVPISEQLAYRFFTFRFCPRRALRPVACIQRCDLNRPAGVPVIAGQHVRPLGLTGSTPAASFPARSYWYSWNRSITLISRFEYSVEVA